MSEVIYMYRRKGQDAWATCDENRYLELGGSHLFEVRIIHTGNEYAALRPTHPAPAEQVEVVCITQGGCNVTWTATKELTQAGTALMSVNQHNRIMAATVPAGCKVVPVELLERIAGRDCDPDCCIAYWRKELRAILEAKDE